MPETRVRTCPPRTQGVRNWVARSCCSSAASWFRSLWMLDTALSRPEFYVRRAFFERIAGIPQRELVVRLAIETGQRSVPEGMNLHRRAVQILPARYREFLTEFHLGEPAGGVVVAVLLH